MDLLFVTDAAGSLTPSIDLKLGDGTSWRHSTDARPLVNAMTRWSPLTFSGKVNQSQMLVDSVVIRVKDSSASDRIIGKAYLSMEGLIDQTNTWQLFRGELVVSQDSGEVGGEYDIYARYRLENEEGPFEYPVEDTAPNEGGELDEQILPEAPAACDVIAVDDIDDDDPDAGHLEVSTVKLKNLSTGKFLWETHV